MSTNEPTQARERITDSPWFWVMLFCGVGLLILLVIAPKYSARQGRLELQYHARQEIARRQVEGTPAAREPGMEGAAPPPGSGELIIPLWPLATLFSLLFLLASFFLWRTRLRDSARASGNRT